MRKFDAIILSGGKGTRVKKFTKYIPKCLIDINGKPFLYYQLKFLKKNKIKNVIISTGYKSEKIEEYLKNNINFINYKIINDGNELLGTGGATVNSLQYLKNNFFIIYGDSYLNFRLFDMIKKKNQMIMALLKNKNKYDKSNVKFTNTENIRYFNNKKKIKKLLYIDYGVSYVNKTIFHGISEKTKFNLSKFYEKISKKNMINGFIVKKRFYEVGSYKGIRDLKRYLKK